MPWAVFWSNKGLVVLRLARRTHLSRDDGGHGSCFTSVIDKDFESTIFLKRRGRRIQFTYDATIAHHVAGRETDQDSGQPEAAGPAAGAYKFLTYKRRRANT
jgi:hypothetical protein